jgi:hypothetical protein
VGDWSEETENNVSGDRRGLGSSGPFTFSHGQEIEFAFAFVTGFSSGSKESTIGTMLRNIDAVKNTFINNDFPEGTPLSVNDNKMEDFDKVILYPNPANKQVEIILNSDDKITKIEILDINGHIINSIKVSNNNNIVDISSFSSGTYLVKVYTGNEYEIKKLIVQ